MEKTITIEQVYAAARRLVGPNVNLHVLECKSLFSSGPDVPEAAISWNIIASDWNVSPMKNIEFRTLISAADCLRGFTEKWEEHQAVKSFVESRKQAGERPVAHVA